MGISIDVLCHKEIGRFWHTFFSRTGLDQADSPPLAPSPFFANTTIAIDFNRASKCTAPPSDLVISL